MHTLIVQLCDSLQYYWFCTYSCKEHKKVTSHQTLLPCAILEVISVGDGWVWDVETTLVCVGGGRGRLLTQFFSVQASCPHLKHRTPSPPHPPVPQAPVRAPFFLLASSFCSALSPFPPPPSLTSSRPSRHLYCYSATRP